MFNNDGNKIESKTFIKAPTSFIEILFARRRDQFDKSNHNLAYEHLFTRVSTIHLKNEFNVNTMIIFYEFQDGRTSTLRLQCVTKKMKFLNLIQNISGHS